MVTIIKYDQFKAEYTHEDTILVLLSGGIDSVCVFHKILTEFPNARIIALHLHFQNREQRNKVEDIAVNKVLQYFQKHNITYVSYPFTFNYKGFIGFDVDIVYFIAAQVVAGEKGNIKYVLDGRNQDDLNRANTPTRSKRTIEIFNAALNGLVDDKPQVVWPIRYNTKKEIIDMMPPDLLQMTWSCRQPTKKGVSFERCGKCITCKELKEQNLWDLTPNSLTH